MANKFTRFVLACDLHGDQQHVPTVKALYAFIRDFKPAVRIAGGDIWDFRPWRKEADEGEKRESTARDFECGVAFLEQFKPTHFVLGNHDGRAWDLAEREDGVDSDLAKQYVGKVQELCRKLGCKIIPHDKAQVLRVGPLNIVHGFTAGENAARRHAQVYSPCISAHVHSGEHVSIPAYPEPREAWTSPALCELGMKYNRKTLGTLRYHNGWTYGFYGSGEFEVFTATRRGGRLFAATDVRDYAAA